MKWSEKQLSAIYEKDKNILVSASAGSGKTAVLSERIVELVCNDQVDISSFLVVTFTKLAANEMKQRILSKLEERFEKTRDEFLERQIVLVEKAQISTLHSFGYSLIKDYFYLLNLEPNVSLIDDLKGKLLKSQIMDNLFEKHYNEGNKNFINLLKMYGSFKKDDGLKAEIKKLANFVLDSISPKEFIENIKKIYSNEVSVSNSSFYNAFKSEAINVIDDLINTIDAWKDVSSVLESDIEKLKDLKSAIGDSYDKAFTYLSDLKFETLRFPKDFDQSDKEKIKKIRDDMKSYVDKQLKKRYFKFSGTELIKQNLEMKESIDYFVDLTKEYINEFAKLKRDMNVIDYNDIEHYTLKLLVNNGELTSIAHEMRKIYKYVIIDEYQDVNELQETILKAVSTFEDKVPNMFMVGDVKQSIYRFRKADPEIFSGKYNSFSYDNSSDNFKIDLSQNFRSRREVLEATNSIFESIMTKETGDVVYDANMKLVYGGLYKDEIKQDYKAELLLISNDKLNNNDNDNETEEDNTDNLEISEDDSESKSNFAELEYYEKEGITIAKRIRDMIDSKFQVYDMKKGTYRDIKYGDFSILLRSLGFETECIYRSLKECGIPVVINKSEGFLTSSEITYILNVLRVINNPLNDIALLATLYSYYFNFTINELYELRKYSHRDESLFESLNKYIYKFEKKECENTNDNLNTNTDTNTNSNISSNVLLYNKIKKFIDFYKEIILFYQKNNVLDTIRMIVNNMLYEKYLVEDEGKIRNIQSLFELADRFTSDSQINLCEFLSQIDEIIEQGEDINVQNEESIENAVTIMTIHKSKGLEFPIVFLPALSKNFNKMDLKSKIILDKHLGMYSTYFKLDKFYMTDNFFKEVIKEKLNKDNIAEEMRILYVAFTRAKEKLILISKMPNKSKAEADEKIDIDSLEEKNKVYFKSLTELKYSYIKKAKSFINMILPIALRDKKNFRVQIIENPEDLRGGSKHLDIKTVLCNNEENEGKNMENNIEINSEINRENREENEYVYPYEDVCNMSSKMSVTSIKKMIRDRKNELNNETNSETNERQDKEEKKLTIRRNAGIKLVDTDEELTGAEKGTVIHKLFRILRDSETVDEDINSLISNKVFTQKEIDSIDISKVKRFLKSTTYERIRNSSFVKREMPFMMNMNIWDLLKTESEDSLSDNKTNISSSLSDEHCIIQGIIDLLFEEDGEIIILDYKTDKVRYSNEEEKECRIKEIRDSYKIQLDLYEKAVEELLKKKVREKVLYLVDIGETVTV